MIKPQVLKPQSIKPIVAGLVIRATRASQGETVAYLHFYNPHRKNIVLNYIHSPVADRIEVHRFLYLAGKKQAQEVRHLSLDPSVSVDFKPGGYHLKLFGLIGELNTGDTVEVNFEFEGLPAISVAAEVRPL